MPFLTWNEGLSVGADAIDDDHKALIGLFNGLLACPVDPAVVGRTLGLIDRLGGHAGSHFGIEEAIMERIGYPEMEAHRRAHADFMERVALLKKVVTGEDNPAIAHMELVSFMTEWFAGHLRAMDLPMRPHILRHIALNGPLAPARPAG